MNIKLVQIVTLSVSLTGFGMSESYRLADDRIGDLGVSFITDQNTVNQEEVLNFKDHPALVGIDLDARISQESFITIGSVAVSEVSRITEELFSTAEVYYDQIPGLEEKITEIITVMKKYEEYLKMELKKDETYTDFAKKYSTNGEAIEALGQVVAQTEATYTQNLIELLEEQAAQ